MSQERFNNETLEKLYGGMVAIDTEGLPPMVEQAVNDGQDVLQVVDALRAGLKVVGDQFEEMIRFLPELIKAANLMQEAMKIIDPELEKLNISKGPTAKISVANIQGDIHDIGRNILSAVLRASGFTVYDLGHDVKADAIIDKSIEYDVDIIGLSSLLTTSLPFTEELMRLLRDRGLRDKFKVVLGGGAVTPAFCEEIGADGYGKDAGSSVKMLQNLL